MKAVLTRVAEASVVVEGQMIGAISACDGPGILALVGVAKNDGSADVSAMVRKIAEQRMLEGDHSAEEIAAPVLVISQFTLLGSTKKGRRPSWSRAAPAEVAEPLVAEVISGLKERGLNVHTGQFGATMQVYSVNLGPFTLLIDTQNEISISDS